MLPPHCNHSLSSTSISGTKNKDIQQLTWKLKLANEYFVRWIMQCIVLLSPLTTYCCPELVVKRLELLATELDGKKNPVKLME